MSNVCTSSEELITLANTAFSALPDKLDKHNITKFSNICEYVADLCSDPKLYRLLMPFHHLTFGWQSAYGTGFTWLKFLQDIIDNDCIDVTYVPGGFGGPSLWFRKSKDSSDYDFRIMMVLDD